jgi:hypothetical protein
MTTSTKRHPKKEVQDAIQSVLLDSWWRFVEGGHWGFLLSGRRQGDGCRIAINATPENPGSHAARIVRECLKCPHRAMKDGNK